MAVYVDNITIYGAKTTLMDNIKKSIVTKFEATDMGNLNWVLGIEILFEKDGIHLSQKSYIDTILRRFKLKNLRPIILPINRNYSMTRSKPEKVLSEPRVYQQMIGSLMYLVTCTRPDLTFVVSYLSQFSNAPNKQHFTAAKRCFRYLIATKDLTLRYRYGVDLFLEGFSDSDYGNCIDTRRSVFGYIFRLGDATICWRSQKQKSVSTSTTEAEYVALSKAAKHFQWIKIALKDLRLSKTDSAVLCDNTSTLDIAENHRISDRSKHIDIHYHRVRELVYTKKLTLLYVPSAENLADICTKGLPLDAFSYLRDKILGVKD